MRAAVRLLRWPRSSAASAASMRAISTVGAGRSSVAGTPR